MKEQTKTKDLSLATERAKAIATIAVTAIVNVLNVLGYAVDAEVWVNAVTSVVAAASIVVCWWFNQNMTEAAVAGQEVVNAEKEGACE